MTKNSAKQEYDEITANEQDSVSCCLDRLSNQIKWLEHVADREFSVIDRDKILAGIRDFYAIVRPMTAKYIRAHVC